MGHDHSHKATSASRLLWAIVINLILTAVQVIGGILSGSLSLIADALHNFSDAGSLIIAFIARKVSGLPADDVVTFGYGRAEILGALINSVILVVVGIYLLYEAGSRYLDPQTIDGWTVIWVAAVALIIDLLTAFLTYAGSKDSVNFRAAFVHNVSDALASVAVIVSGVLILNFQVFWVDALATALISIYVLYQSIGLIKSTMKTLMQGMPEGLSRLDIAGSIMAIPGVWDVHHIHVWGIHERFRSLEAHVKVTVDTIGAAEGLKAEIRTVLKSKYHVGHANLEIEPDREGSSALGNNSIHDHEEV